MKRFSFTYCDSRLLFIVYYLMAEYSHAMERGNESNHGKGFFDYPGFYESDAICEMIPDKDFYDYLVSLCKQYGVIKELYIDHFKEEAFSDLLKSLRYKFDDNNDDYDPFAIFTPKPKGSESHMYSINLDPSAVWRFIESYLRQWKNDELFMKEKNFLKAEKQTEKIVKEIYSLLKDHPDKNLIVNQESHHDDLDFVAVMMFLEKIGDIKIVHIGAVEDHLSFTEKNKYLWAFRINIYKKFYDDFKEKMKGLTFEFDFEYLKTGLKSKKNTESETIKNNVRRHRSLKVEYDPLKLQFYFGGKSIHRINEGTTPCEVFNNAFGGEKVQHQLPHGKTGTKRVFYADQIKGLRNRLRVKLKKAKAPKELTDSFLIRLNGGLVEITEQIILKNTL